ncbi:ABC transporter ATP-binding protein [Oceanicaulis sp.]|uniref:ABC transporter ATP-binding protein n=1 Tax=Oceanicaulis sp. TaxID=1924941 RepID=UPI003BACEC57
MSQEGATSLVLDHVTVKRGGVSVLKDVTLGAARGQMTALVGPNGAGKSTLIKTILGLLKAESGAVWVEGAPVQSLSPKARARTMAYLPQDRSLAWSMTGGDLAALGRFAWGGAAYDRLSHADRAQVDLALEHASASHLRDRLVHDLSGGEQARLHLARALASQAPILLADEPIAALDPRHQLEAMQVLRRQADEGATVICALHDLELARRHADQIAVLDCGHLRIKAAPHQALSDEILAEVFGVQRTRSDGFDLL